jgi:hypothetical protein
MQSAWNAWPHAGSARTAGWEPAPAGSSDRHTAHSWDVAGNGEPASAAAVAPLRASSYANDSDDASDRTAAVAAAMVTAPTIAMAAGN